MGLERIAGPVLDALGFTASPAEGQVWPRVWWCPTGPLTALPLHAAGYHEDASLACPPTVIDRVVPSYTPTVKALIEARRRTFTQKASAAEGRLLVVAQENTPGQPPLPQVARERALLARLFPGRHTLLTGDSATREAVQSGLSTHQWVHLSCHGTQDLAHPSEGGIFLADGMLSIAQISAGGYDGSFAFLSACKTATGSISLPDEVITLAAALHYTGYRHVIAAMWSVWDDAAADIAEIVYANMLSEEGFLPDSAPTALHKAVRVLRDRDRNEQSPSIWSHFIHTGP